jgi:hypothetical protein
VKLGALNLFASVPLARLPGGTLVCQRKALPQSLLRRRYRHACQRATLLTCLNRSLLSLIDSDHKGMMIGWQCVALTLHLTGAAC